MEQPLQVSDVAPIDSSKVESQIKLAGKVTLVIGIILLILTLLGFGAMIFVSSSESNLARSVMGAVGTQGLMWGYVAIGIRLVLVAFLVYLGNRIKEGGTDKKTPLTWALAISIALFLWFAAQDFTSIWTYVVLAPAWSCDQARRAIKKLSPTS